MTLKPCKGCAASVEIDVTAGLLIGRVLQWTPEGAHLLLQVRTQVLNDDWEATFRSWYPGFRPTIVAHATPAAA
jgi:hypothetical protein